MAFRKRNVAVGRTPGVASNSTAVVESFATGVRPSTLTSHPVTSTGTPSLDGLLGGHSGLALGSSFLVEESGTTDFAGALLKYYAAEGICQGHTVHVVGVGEGWVRELPGVAADRSKDKPAKSAADEEKMRIAWRYERLGQAGERALPDRSVAASSSTGTASPGVPFNHTFDLTKRLTLPQDAKVNLIPIPHMSAFPTILKALSNALAASPPSSVHRLVMPSILSPALYPPDSNRPENFLAFLRALRALLREHSARLTAMLTLPLELYPRTSGLVRWAEILSDGVLEMTPFPHLMDSITDTGNSGGTGKDEQPQGMVKLHKLPITTERGEGGAGAGNSLGEDLAFTVSRRKFVIKPFSLPPVEGDTNAQAEGGQLTKKDVEF